MEKFEIKNSTVKPVRRDKDGKDIRPAVEKVGHPISYKVGKEGVTVLNPGMHSIVSDLNEGILGLQRGGFITIRKITDIAQEFKDHAIGGSETTREARATFKGDQKPHGKATATEMGLDAHKQRGGAETDEAVNPDGDPNFLASSKAKTRKRRNSNAGVTGNNSP